MVLKSNSYEEGVVQSYKVSVVFYDEEHREWSVEQNSISGVSLPGGSDSKESAHDAGDPGSISGRADPPEKGVATHSSILAWRIPWVEEPGRLQSIGSQRAGHD